VHAAPFVVQRPGGLFQVGADAVARESHGGRGPQAGPRRLPIFGAVHGHGAQQERLVALAEGPINDRAGQAAALGLDLPAPRLTAAQQHAVARSQLGLVDSIQRAPSGVGRESVTRVVAMQDVDVVGVRRGDARFGAERQTQRDRSQGR